MSSPKRRHTVHPHANVTEIFAPSLAPRGLDAWQTKKDEAKGTYHDEGSPHAAGDERGAEDAGVFRFPAIEN